MNITLIDLEGEKFGNTSQQTLHVCSHSAPCRWFNFLCWFNEFFGPYKFILLVWIFKLRILKMVTYFSVKSSMTPQTLVLFISVSFLLLIEVVQTHKQFSTRFTAKFWFLRWKILLLILTIYILQASTIYCWTKEWGDQPSTLPTSCGRNVRILVAKDPRSGPARLRFF